MPRFPSKEWAEAYCRELNNNPNYERSGKGWVWPILFKISKLPEELDKEFEGKKPGFILKLNNGKCEGVEWYDDASQADAPFILSATYNDWLDIISGKINPLTAILRRKLVVEKGNYSVIMRYPIAALEMVKTAQRVGVE
ncbi:MAG: SCP2 sterol-binding domain-containing protein [Desulfurococcales archaeon]|nr:SCP2 sterol-binding domain-containing protein [Desulfurococcales archaeon]